MRFEKHRAYRLKHRRAIYEATDGQYDRSDKKDAEEDDGAFASTTGCRGVEGGRRAGFEFRRGERLLSRHVTDYSVGTAGIAANPTSGTVAMRMRPLPFPRRANYRVQITMFRVPAKYLAYFTNVGDEL